MDCPHLTVVSSNHEGVLFLSCPAPRIGWLIFQQLNLFQKKPKKQLIFLFYLAVELKFSWKKHPKHKIYAMVGSSASFSTGVEKLGENKSLFIGHTSGLKYRKNKTPQNLPQILIK